MTAVEPMLDRARAGEREAWNQLLQQLRPIIRALARRRLRCDNEASDLAQEVLLRMDRAFSGFRGRSVGQLLAWARTITANVLIDRARSAPPPAEPLPPDLGADVESGSASGLIRAEEMARLAAALPKLPEHYRTVVEARLFEGISCADLARRMGQTPVWVRVTCLRAVRLLQQELGVQP
jgi:RNA polymerase sigma-70 factor (ECF subfamily)